MLHRSRAVVLSLGLGVGSLGAVGGIAIAAGDEQRPVAPVGPQLQDMQPFIDRQAKEDRERIAEAERVGPLELAGLSDEEALRALRKRLPGLVGRKATAQLDAKKGERVKRYVGLGTQALVEDEKTGRKQLVQSSLPLRVPTSDEEGAPLEPLSTEVEARGDELAAENVPSQYRIARRLGASSGLPNHASSWFTEARFGVVPLAGGRPLGGGQAKLLSDKSVVLNAARDLDYVTAAGAGGSQGMFVLRSKRSPTRLGVRVVGDVDEVREGERRLGAEIVRGRTVVGRLQAPIAADANGTSVPVDWKLDGDVMRMAVDLDDPAIRLPVVVDPSVVEDQRYWVSNTAIDFTGWEFGSATPSFYPTAKGTGFYGYGLTIYSDSTKTFPAGTFGTWTFRAPFDPAFIDEGAHIINVDFGYTAHVPAGGTGSCMQQGIYDPRNTTASYPAGQFENAYWKFGTPTSTTAGPYYGYGGGLGMYTCAAEGTMWNTATYKYRTHGMTQPFDWNGSSPTAGRPANMAVFGLSNGVGKPSANGLAYLGSSLIRMSEQVAPHLTTTGQPTGWVHAAPGFTATATDYGLGSTQVSAAASGMATQTSTPPACLSTSLNPPTGVNPNNGVGNQGDRNNRCPKVLSKAIDTSALPEGANTVTLTGKDLMDNQATLAVPVKVDRSKPTIEQLNPGQVVRPAAPAGSSAPTKISVKAKDQYSGVKTVTVKVDGQPVTVTQPTCAATQCPVEYSFDIPASQLRDGQHQVKVVVTDLVGTPVESHVTESTFSVTVFHDPTNPPTDPGIDLGRQPLAGLGTEDWWSFDSITTGAGSSFRTNLATGGAVWTHTPVANPGVGLNTFLKLTYNSFEPSGLLPELLRGLGAGGNGLLGYGVAGRGFSVQLAGLTRLNEPLQIKGPGGLTLSPDAPAEQATKILLVDGDGTQHEFVRSTPAGSSTIRFQAPKGVRLELRRYATSGDRYWAATRTDGVTFFFSREGLAREISDRLGNRIRFEYETGPAKPLCGWSLDCTQRVKRVIDAAGNSTTDLDGIPSGQSVEAQRAWELSYDADGRLSEVRDRKLISRSPDVKRVTRLTYDADNRLETITENADGAAALRRKLKLGYEGTTTFLTSVEDPEHAVTAIKYREAPTDVLSQLEDFIRGLTGLPSIRQVESVADRGNADQAGRARTYRFEAPAANHPRLAWVKNPRGVVDKVSLDDRGRMTALEQAVDDPQDAEDDPDPAPRVTAQGWTDQNQLDWREEALQESAKTVTFDYAWGDLGELLEEKEHAGNHTQTETTSRSRTWDYRRHNGTLDAAPGDDHAFVYDLAKTTDSRGKPTTYVPTADDTGNVAEIKRTVDGSEYTAESFTYSSRGLVLTRASRLWPEGGKPSWAEESTVVTESFREFDGNGDPRLRIDPRLGNWRTLRDEVGNAYLVGDPRAGVLNPTVRPEAALEDDADPVAAIVAGNATTVRDDARTLGQAYTARWAIDQLDRPIVQAVPKRSGAYTPAVTDRFRVTATTYDLNDNVTASRNAESHVSTKAYTKTGQLRTETSPAVGHFDGSDLSPESPRNADPEAEVTRYAYDKVDNLVQRSDPLGGGLQDEAHRTEWTYDRFDRPIVETRTAATGGERKITTSKAYDARDNVVGEADANTNADVSAVQAAQNARNPATQRWQYQYDTFNRVVVEEENPAQSGEPASSTVGLDTRFEYDLEDHVTKKTTPAGRVTEYEYDDRGSLVKRRDPFGYDQDARSTTRKVETVYKRRLDGRLSSLTTPRAQDDDDPANASGDDDTFQTRLSYYDTGELRHRYLPRAHDQYGTNWRVGYDVNAVGDPEWIRDTRGALFENEFLDSGELASTDRPSWWTYDQEQGAIRERSDGDRGAAQPGDGELPSAPGNGDFGKVDPMALPGALPAKGSTSFGYDDELRLNRVTGQDDSGNGHLQQYFRYDVMGRLAEREIPYLAAAGTDPAQKIFLRWYYDKHGNVRATEDGRGQATLTDYDGFDRPSSVSRPPSCDPGPSSCVRPVASQTYDRNGNTLVQTLPSAGDSTARTGSGTTGTRVRSYDSVDRVIDEVDPAGALTEFAYDRDGELLTEYRPHPAGANRDRYATGYVRDGAGRVTKESSTVTDQGTLRTLQTTTSYDDDGNPRKTVSPGSKKDSADQDETAREQQVLHDARGLPWVTTVGAGSEAKTTVSEYDGEGQLRRTVKPEGVDGDGPSARPTHADTTGDPIDGEAAHHAEVRSYDANNLLTSRVLPWDEPAGDEVGDGNPDADADHRKRWRQDFTYTSRGLAKAITGIYNAKTGGGKAGYDTEIDYNDAGWPSTKRERDGDGAGQFSTYQTLRYEYDKQGNQRAWIAGGGDRVRQVQRRFYPSGQMKSRCGLRKQRDGENVYEDQIYSFAYNRSGQLIQTKDWMHYRLPELNGVYCQAEDFSEPGGIEPRSTNVKRDKAGRPAIVNEAWGSGRDTAYSYEGGMPSRIASVTTDGTLSGDDVTGGTTSTFAYDEQDRNTRVTVSSPAGDHRPGNRVTDLTWWPSGDRRTITKPTVSDGGETKETRYYDSTGQIAKRHLDPATGDDTTQTYGYDENGNRTTDERGTHTYNARDQLVRWEREHSGSATSEQNPDKDVRYTLDGAGRRLEVVDETKADQDDDQLGVVTTKVTTTNIFEGDRIVRAKREITASADGATSTTKYQTDCSNYNAFGSLLRTRRKKSTETSCPGATTPTDWKVETQYTYDAFERLLAGRERKHDDPGEDDDPELDGTQVYCYDGLDRRDRRVTGLSGSKDPGAEDQSEDDSFEKARSACVEDDDPSAGIRAFDYSYVGLTEQLTREARHSGVQTYEYTAHGERLGRLKGPIDGSTTPKYRAYETDAQASVIGLESSATGRASSSGADGSDRYNTDPFGEPLGPEKDLSPDAESNPFRYQGFYKDQETGLYDMQARAYRPKLGQFLQQDRYGSASGDIDLAADPLTSSRYAFTAGDPVGRNELDGHSGYSWKSPLDYIVKPIVDVVTKAPVTVAKKLGWRLGAGAVTAGVGWAIGVLTDPLLNPDTANAPAPPTAAAAPTPKAAPAAPPKAVAASVPAAAAVGALVGRPASTSTGSSAPVATAPSVGRPAPSIPVAPAPAAQPGAVPSTSAGLGFTQATAGGAAAGGAAAGGAPDPGGAEPPDFGGCDPDQNPIECLADNVGFGPLKNKASRAADEIVDMLPYRKGGGHHVPAKSMFRGDAKYSNSGALAVPNRELERLGIDHRLITSAQQREYAAFRATGDALTWRDVYRIERRAMIAGGATPDAASQVVRRGIRSVRDAGVAKPTRIPWGG